MTTATQTLTGTLCVNSLKVECIIGCCDEERQRPRTLVMDVRATCDVHIPAHSDDVNDAVDYEALARCAETVAREGKFHIVEALASAIADTLLAQFPLRTVWIRISKPGAIAQADSCGIELSKESCAQ